MSPFRVLTLFLGLGFYFVLIFAVEKCDFAVGRKYDHRIFLERTDFVRPFCLTKEI